MTTRLDPMRLGAFVDGELTPDEARALEAALRDDPEAAALVARLRADREALAQAFDAALDAPLPEAVLAMLDPSASAGGAGSRPTATVLAFPVWRRAPVVAGGLALAASALLAVGLTLRPANVPNTGHVAAGVVDASGGLHAALETGLSGERRAIEGGASVDMIASFATGKGAICREFRVSPADATSFEHGVACREGTGWSVEIVTLEVAETDAGDTGYIPSEGPGTRAVERLLDEIGAGFALDPEAEAAALQRGWR